MTTDTLFLRYTFTEAEIKERSAELARTITKAMEAEESKKAAVAQFADLILCQREKMSRLAREINNGYEMRDIQCEIRFHVPSKGIAQIVRLDTGELVKERPMDHYELQEQLFPENGEPNTKKEEQTEMAKTPAKKEVKKPKAKAKAATAAGGETTATTE